VGNRGTNVIRTMAESCTFSAPGAAEWQEVCFFEAPKHVVSLSDRRRFVSGSWSVDACAQLRAQSQIGVDAAVTSGRAGGEPRRITGAAAREQIREYGITPGIAPFVIQTGDAGRDDGHARAHSGLDRRGLRIRQSTDVWQDEHAQSGGRLNVVDMDGNVWNARAHERVHEARIGRVDALGGIVPAEEVGIAL
jgi:hypothetical protein